MMRVKKCVALVHLQGLMCQKKTKQQCTKYRCSVESRYFDIVANLVILRSPRPECSRLLGAMVDVLWTFGHSGIIYIDRRTATPCSRLSAKIHQTDHH